MGGNPFLPSVSFWFLWVLGDVTSVTTPLYILFWFLVPRIGSKERKTNLWVCCPETDFCSSLFENPNNHRMASMAANFLLQASGFFIPFSIFKFSYLRSRSASKKFIFTVCYVFDRFCPQFCIASFAGKVKLFQS